MNNTILNEIFKIKFLENYKRGVVISEQVIKNIPIFGSVNIGGLQELGDNFVEINATDKGFELIPQEGFKGILNNFSDGFITKVSYNDITQIFPNRLIDRYNYSELPRIPFLVKKGSDLKLLQLQLKFIPNKKNKKVPLGKHTIKMGNYFDNEDVVINENINPVPGGNLIIFGQELKGFGYGFGGESKKPEARKKPIGMKAKDPFIFNTTDFLENTLGIIDDFVNDIYSIKKSKDPKAFEKYIQIVKNKKQIPVKAYASIDDDPNQVIDYVEGKNAVEGCGGKRKRGDYNQCLSQKRADKVAQILNSKIPELSGIFVGQGMGETDKFAPGKKWPEIKDKSKTEENRIFIVDNMPDFEFSV